MEMPEDEVKQLAFDVGSGFFKDAQLCDRYDLDIRQLKHIKEQRPFKKQVDEVARLLQDDGSEFVVLAKGYAKNCLETCNEVATDPAASDASRIAASKVIFQMARLNVLPAKGEGGVSQGSLVINTNLSLNQSPVGAYTIEAAAVQQQQVIEAEYVQIDDQDRIDYGDLL